MLAIQCPPAILAPPRMTALLLQGEIAAAAQSCSDTAKEMLQHAHAVHAERGSASCRRAAHLERQQARRRLAAQACAAAAACSSHWQPYSPRQPLCSQCKAEVNPCKAHVGPLTHEDDVDCELAFALNAIAARAEANEQAVQHLLQAVEDTVAQHAEAMHAEQQDAVKGLSRWLEVANASNSLPSESSIKQLVCLRHPTADAGLGWVPHLHN
jgi:hypothetical protein